MCRGPGNRSRPYGDRYAMAGNMTTVRCQSKSSPIDILEYACINE